MKITASISLELTKKFIKTARRVLKSKYGTNDPIEKLFQKYGYGRTKQKYRIILRTDGQPAVSTNVAIPRVMVEFLELASAQWLKVKGKPVQLAFENYIIGSLYNKLDPLTPLDKRGPTYFLKLLSMNRKVIGTEKYEEIRQLYDSDRQRAPTIRSKLGKKFLVVISRHPYDILGYSSGRSWSQSSCLSIDGCHFVNFMPAELKNSLVAFMIPAEDLVMARLDRMGLRSERKTAKVPDTQLHFTRVGLFDRGHVTRKEKAFDLLSRPVARIAIKPYYDDDGNVVLYPGREYGDTTQEFVHRVARFVWLHNRKQPTGLYNLTTGLYPDHGQPMSTWFSSNLSKLDRMQVDELLDSKLVTPKMLLNTWYSLDHTKSSDRSTALSILRNPLLPRAIFADAYEKEDKEYLAELTVYQKQLLSPQFSKYLISRYRLFETLILRGDASTVIEFLSSCSESELEVILTKSTEPDKLLSRIMELAVELDEIPTSLEQKLKNIVLRQPIETFFTPERIKNLSDGILKDTFIGSLSKSYLKNATASVTKDIEGFKEFLNNIPQSFRDNINIAVIRQLYPKTFHSHVATLIERGKLTRNSNVEYLSDTDMLEVLDYLIDNNVTYNDDNLMLFLLTLSQTQPKLSAKQAKFIAAANKLHFRFIVEYPEIAKAITIDQIHPPAETDVTYIPTILSRISTITSNNTYTQDSVLTEYVYRGVVRFLSDWFHISTESDIISALVAFSEIRPLALVDIQKTSLHNIKKLAKYNFSVLIASRAEYIEWYEREPEPDRSFPYVIRGTEIIDLSDDSMLFESYFVKCAQLLDQNKLDKPHLYALLEKIRAFSTVNDMYLPKYSELWVKLITLANKLGYDAICRKVYSRSAPVLPSYISQMDTDLTIYNSLNILHLLNTDYMPASLLVPPTVTEEQARQLWPKLGVGEFPGYNGTILLQYAPEFKIPEEALNDSLLKLFSCVYEYTLDMQEPRYLVGPITPKTIYLLSINSSKLVFAKGVQDVLAITASKEPLKKESIDRIIIDCPSFMLIAWKAQDESKVFEWLFSESTVAKAILYGHDLLTDDLFDNKKVSTAIVRAREYFLERLHGRVATQFFADHDIMGELVEKLVSISAKLHRAIDISKMAYVGFTEDKVNRLLELYSEETIHSYSAATSKSIAINQDVSIDSLLFMINSNIAKDEALTVSRYLLNYAFMEDSSLVDQLLNYGLDFWQSRLGNYRGEEFFDLLQPEPSPDDPEEDNEDAQDLDEDDVEW